MKTLENIIFISTGNENVGSMAEAGPGWKARMTSSSSVLLTVYTPPWGHSSVTSVSHATRAPGGHACLFLRPLSTRALHWWGSLLICSLHSRSYLFIILHCFRLFARRVHWRTETLSLSIVAAVYGEFYVSSHALLAMLCHWVQSLKCFANFVTEWDFWLWTVYYGLCSLDFAKY